MENKTNKKSKKEKSDLNILAHKIVKEATEDTSKPETKGKDNAPGQNKEPGGPADGKGKDDAPGQNKEPGEPANGKGKGKK